MKNRFFGLLSIHLAALLFGVAGLFGKTLDLSPLLIVFGRVFFASSALLVVFFVQRTSVRVREGKHLLVFFLMGSILSVHWVAFFHAIQVSTVAIGLLTFASFPIFVTFLEPLFFGERMRAFDVLIAVVVGVGLSLVVPVFDLSNNMTLGVFWGMVSSLTFSLLVVLNRWLVAHYPPLAISFFQDGIACLLLLPLVGGSFLSISWSELGQLALLGVLFTAVAHTLFISGMQVVKAQLASVIACSEPVYGILLAVVLLHEVPSIREILGATIVIGVMICATRRSVIAPAAP